MGPQIHPDNIITNPIIRSKSLNFCASLTFIFTPPQIPIYRLAYFIIFLYFIQRIVKLPEEKPVTPKEKGRFNGSRVERALDQQRIAKEEAAFYNETNEK